MPSDCSSSPPDASPAFVRDIYLARQPIFDRDLNVRAYEVLFRSNAENRATITDADQATSQLLLNAFVNIGLDQIVGDRYAFVNLTRPFLTGDYPLPLAADRLVLEILEDIEIDAELVAGVGRLVDDGYTLALDDVTFDEKLRPLLSLARIVKVELPKIPRHHWRTHLQRFRDEGDGLQILAEKVETQTDYEFCRDIGFDLFQGHFFCRPEMLSGKEPTSNQAAVLQLMSRLSHPDVTVDELEQLLKYEPSLTFKLLQYVNSTKCGVSRRIDSLRQAIVLLGIEGVRTLTTLAALSNLSSHPHGALKLAILRAFTCEKLAIQMPGSDGSACFTAGLISLLDSILGISRSTLLSRLPLSDTIRNAVTKHEGRIGEILRCASSFEEVDQAPYLCDQLTAEQARTALVCAIAESERIWAAVQ